AARLDAERAANLQQPFLRGPDGVACPAIRQSTAIRRHVLRVQRIDCPGPGKNNYELRITNYE
ncbi:MAG TPA: hypothetical protein PLC06_15625, partial [Promineifilum sp.]|nr:hypothetical protein [Promineifilum sp.]